MNYPEMDARHYTQWFDGQPNGDGVFADPFAPGLEPNDVNDMDTAFQQLSPNLPPSALQNHRKYASWPEYYGQS